MNFKNKISLSEFSENKLKQIQIEVFGALKYYATQYMLLTCLNDTPLSDTTQDIINLTNGVVTLSNGKKVGNFSSPHEFTFTDGSVLCAVDRETAEKLKVDFYEKDLGDGDIELSFGLNLNIIRRMQAWDWLNINGHVDVVFCPLPMIASIKEEMPEFSLKNSPFRTIRIEDRIKKLVSIEKQCL